MTQALERATDSSRQSRSRALFESRLIVWPLIVLTFFIVVAPTLVWLEFYFGSEAVNVATALEIRRSGNWLMPTLQGEPRLAKPPLTAWITAASIRESTMRDLSNRDPSIRAAAYERLAWEARWPGLLGACILLIAIYEFGRAIGGGETGLIATLIGGSTLMFLRQSRLMQTDLQLAIWVGIANAFLADALLRSRTTWTNVVGAGIALGVAMLAKGPIALLMILAPAIVFLLCRRKRLAFDARWLVGFAIMIGVGTWWYAWAAATHASGWRVFFAEATRYGANTLDADPMSRYLTGVPRLFLPWTPLLVIGVIVAARDATCRQINGVVLAMLILVLPLLVMICFKERKERYLTPFLLPGAALAAAGIVALPRCRGRAIVVGALAAASLAWNFQYCRNQLKSGGGRSIMKPLADAAYANYPDAILNAYASADTQSAYLLVPGAETAIYLNRPIHWTRDPSMIVPTDRPQLLLVVRPDRVAFAPPDARWRSLIDDHRRGVHREIFAMPAAPASRTETSDRSE